MNAPGKSLLKVVSILFIIGSIIVIIISILTLLTLTFLPNMIGGLMDEYASEFGDFSNELAEVSGLFGSLVSIALILGIITSVIQLIIGIIGLKKCGDPSQAQFFIVTGIILCLLSLVSIILSAVGGDFQFTGVIGFVLPILYIVGGLQNKKAISSSK